MTETGFERSLKLHRDRFMEVVRCAPDTKEATNLEARFAVVEVTDGSTYDMSQDYFRFLFAAGVEPTNNHSEQQVRHIVINRRPFYRKTRRKARAANPVSATTNACGPRLPPARSNTKTSSNSYNPQSSPN